MCHIGYRAGNRTGVSYLHYAQGTLAWSRYHAHREEEFRRLAAEHPEGSDGRRYFEERAEFSARAKLGFDPSLHLDGSERRAGMGGFWQVSGRKAEAAWRRHARSCDESDHDGLDHCALFLDFDRHHAVIRDQGFCDWQESLPDGWTFEFAEMPEDAPSESDGDRPLPLDGVDS
jgi:hypothetical protein